MTKFLVAADADQIQNLLFRSSRLREVIGGSMLLSDFCHDVRKQLEAQAEVIISAGGSFRIEFSDAGKAKIFMEALAEAYRMRNGGSLTVAGPEEYEDGGFQKANTRLQQKLVEAKLNRSGCEAVFHLPVTAYCASCGVEIATQYGTTTPELPSEQQQWNYLCEACKKKAEHRKEELTGFYAPFQEALSAESWKRPVGKDRSYITKRYWKIPSDPADVLGSLDPTHYVGYLIADGNGMGKLFSQQDSPDKLKAVSDRLTRAMWASLAAPVPLLMDRIEERQEKGMDWCPVVPLIVGGDDLFALIPARYALDTARLVGEVFEREMEGKASLGIAVVICQNHYPYTLAHERGEELLNASKRLGKSLGGVSAVNFDVIVGNELANGKEAGNGRYEIPRTTLKPYFIGQKAGAHPAAGLPLAALMEQRLTLKKMPGKRKAELRALFNPLTIQNFVEPKKRQHWKQELQTLQVRLDDEIADKLAGALYDLGESKKGSDNVWRAVQRPDEEYLAQGLPDLIEAWDYAYRLDIPDWEYDTEEE